MSLQKHHMSWLCAFLRHSQTFSFKNDNKKHDSSENQMRWKNVWSANDDNNFYSLPYIKNASSLLFTMPSTLVMCLQITVNPFQSASEHTKSRETTSRSKTRLVICFQICHRGKHTHTQIHTIKKAERYGKGGVHQKKKDQHGSSHKDTAVYLQRDRARWRLKRKDARRCFRPVTHTHCHPQWNKDIIPPDKHPQMAISTKIAFISMHWTCCHGLLLLKPATHVDEMKHFYCLNIIVHMQQRRSSNSRARSAAWSRKSNQGPPEKAAKKIINNLLRMMEIRRQAAGSEAPAMDWLS